MRKREDIYYNRAKKAGYRSRAAYKLIEIDRKFEILSRAHYILEIGSSPGGWTDVLMERTPEYLLCVDISAKKIRCNAIFHKGRCHQRIFVE